MENLPLLVPLVILVPALGRIYQFFLRRQSSKRSGRAISAVSLRFFAFIVSLLLLTYVTGTNGGAAVVNPPFVDGWLRIDSIGLDISWQQRVDSLSVTMMLVVTGVGSLIHLYARGYMHGDKWYPRFFAYLNMFLAFMLILVTANNFLMLFVGWEGVGLVFLLAHRLLVGQESARGLEEQQRRAQSLHRQSYRRLSVLMAMFLIFWTFGTLDFHKAGELPNTEAKYLVHWREHNGLLDHHEEADAGKRRVRPTITPMTGMGAATNACRPIQPT